MPTLGAWEGQSLLAKTPSSAAVVTGSCASEKLMIPAHCDGRCREWMPAQSIASLPAPSAHSMQ